MAENFKLPGSSYEEFVKIIQAYSSGKPGQAMSLEVVAQIARMDKTVVSRNNGFLVQSGLVTEGNQKAATEVCLNLGRAYQLKIDTEITKNWKEIIENNEFLFRMLSAIRIRKTMEKTAVINHIVYSSGATTGKNSKVGAATIIELLKTSRLVSEQDGQIIAVENDIQEVESEKNGEDQKTLTIQKKMENLPSEEINGNRICINININVNASEIDTLLPKIDALIDRIKG